MAGTRRLLSILALVLALGGPGSLGVHAAPGPAAPHGPQAQDGAYTANLYAGACGDLNVTMAATAIATTESGSEEAGWSYAFALETDLPLADLVSAPHAISVEVNDGDLATTVACAELAGEVVGSRLIVGLPATGTGELAGVAVVTGTEGEPVRVEVYLIVAADGTTLGAGDETESDPVLDAVDDADDSEDPDDEDEPVSDDGV